MSVILNVIISGASVSGDIDTAHTAVTIDLGNSDKIGQITFDLQNSTGTYTSKLVSGNARVQVDAIEAPGVKRTIFTGTLERLENIIDDKGGTQSRFTGYDYAQELLGLVSPDARQISLILSGVMSLTSGDQGMGSRDGMDMVIYVSGVVGSGSAGSITSGVQLNLFMSQYFGKSGDTTGSNSGASFSFKPYASGMVIWGNNPAYNTWYVQDGASDTNANYWIPYATIRAKHEYAWDVLRKITRHGYVIDRSGYKAQFEVYVDVSGGINLITSGSSNFFASGVVLQYYVAGTSGATLNNILNAKIPYDTTPMKNDIIGWFPVWSIYPFGDDYSDVVSFSGSYWSGSAIGPAVWSGAVAILSGNISAPNAPGFISIMSFTSGKGSALNGFVNSIFTFWSGYSLDILRWNVSGGVGVSLNYVAQASVGAFRGSAEAGIYNKTVAIYDTSGASICKSGFNSTTSEMLSTTTVLQSGWSSITELIFSISGTFYSGTGQDGGWKSRTSGNGAASGNTINRSGSIDMTRIKQIEFGFNANLTLGDVNSGVGIMVYMIDNVNFQFAFNYNPVIASNSGSMSVYGRRYETFEFPYQTTDSGAASVVLAELQSKSQNRQLADFTIKDNPLQPFSYQLLITPGKIFIVDAPSQNTGSGQTFYYWRATDVKHEWSHKDGFITYVKAYPWTSGGSAQSGQNLISYSLPAPIPIQRVESQMPNTHWWHGSRN